MNGAAADGAGGIGILNYVDNGENGSGSRGGAGIGGGGGGGNDGGGGGGAGGNNGTAGGAGADGLIGGVGGGGGVGILFDAAGNTVTINADIRAGNGGNIGVGSGGSGGGGGVGVAVKRDATLLLGASRQISGSDGGGGGAGVFFAGVNSANQFGTIASGSFTNLGSVKGGNGGSASDNFYSGGAGGDGLRGNNVALANSGSITGGDGGDGGGFGGDAGFGGAGVYIFGNDTDLHSTITNTGTIEGGNAGANSGGTAGAGGVGVSMTGNANLLINSGIISGGMDTDGVQANAVTITGGSGNIVELHTGYAFTGNVDASAGTNSILRLGGDSNASTAATDVFTGFDRLEKTGASRWTLGNTRVMDFSGKTVALDITGLAAGDTLIAAGGNLDIDGAALEVAATSGIYLYAGQRATLIADPLGQLASPGAPFQAGRRTLAARQDGAGRDVYLALLAIQSFTGYQGGILDPGGWSNSNLVSGAQYLDRLETGGYDPAALAAIERIWDSALGLGGRPAALALQQFYGAYAAYANTGLQISSGGLRSLWQRRTASQLLDWHVFAGLWHDNAGAGIASADALASPLYGARDTVPAGRSRVWASGFGSWAKQDAADNLAGYKWDAQGFALGYEYSFNNCFQIGFGAAYSKGDLKVDDLRYENEPDILNLALYGVYTHPSGLYAQGGFGYGHAWNDYTVNMIVPPYGQKKGKYGSDDFPANLELGYVARLPRDFNLIPSVGLEYDYLRNGGWTEGLSNPALVANRFDSGHDTSLGVPLGLRFNKLFRFGCNGGYVIPEVRAAFVWQADASRPFVNAGYAGAPGSARMVGVDPGNNYWRFGAGVSGRFNERVDFRVDYDFDTRSGFRGHNVLATVGVSF